MSMLNSGDAYRLQDEVNRLHAELAALRDVSDAWGYYEDEVRELRAKIVRLRDELAKVQQHDSYRSTAHWKKRAEEAEAAVLRVRELATSERYRPMAKGTGHDYCLPTHLVLRTLDGES